MDKPDVLKQLDEEGVTYDTAYPVDWARRVRSLTGLWPRGVVWLYDQRARIFGRPFAVTMYGWWVLQMAGEVQKPILKEAGNE